MNRRGLSIALLALMMFLVPLLALTGRKVDVHFLPSDIASQPGNNSQQKNHDESELQETDQSFECSDSIAISGDDFRILDEKSGKVLKVSAQEYVRGAVAAELPPTFHPEALKAQAVAAHTYALYKREQARANGEKTDFSANPENWSVFTTEKQFRERYDDMADTYWETICEAADEASAYVLTYEGEPIVAAYHSMSSGQTEDASNVWSGGEPYLVPVESFGDTLAPDYRVTETFTPQELETALKNTWPDLSLKGDASNWIGKSVRSPSGYVTELTIGNQTVPGAQVRTALDLRSSDFTISYENGTFTFKVVGYGHGVGLSQYGADYMARQGASFDEILLHYYPGTTLSIAAVS